MKIAGWGGCKMYSGVSAPRADRYIQHTAKGGIEE